ncbi:MAG: cyclic pyranopterin monophosphate synthase MoaC [Planctomycetaceae bacterium]
MAVKRTADLIPLCHPSFVEASRNCGWKETTIRITVEDGHRKNGCGNGIAHGGFGGGALTLYDMCKSLDRGMEIGPIRLPEKSGGRSGRFLRKSDVCQRNRDRVPLASREADE